MVNQSIVIHTRAINSFCEKKNMQRAAVAEFITNYKKKIKK